MDKIHDLSIHNLVTKVPKIQLCEIKEYIISLKTVTFTFYNGIHANLFFNFKIIQ